MEELDIESILPHRYPFLLVDGVREIQVGDRLTAFKNISRSDPILQGHFPGKAIYPGVLIVEALAQAAGILYASSQDKLMENKTSCFLAGTDRTRFKKKVLPGDQVELEIQILQLRKRIMKAIGYARVGNELACSTEISLFVETQVPDIVVDQSNILPTSLPKDFQSLDGAPRIQEQLTAELT